MNSALTGLATGGKHRLRWIIAAAGAAILAAAIATAVTLATRASARPTTTQPPTQAGYHPVTRCAPDDTQPIGPDGQGIPACLTR